MGTLKYSLNEPTGRAEIFIAGDILEAKKVCRAYCTRGLCVTIEPTTYIYTGGEEVGMRIGLINYPKFPCSQKQLTDTALDLADTLREALFQESYSVVTPERTYWRSWR
jgi:hypothetical protein